MTTTQPETVRAEAQTTNGKAGISVADPYAEVRITSLSATRGANYWSRSPITRMDLVVGAYEDISSADVPGFTERLIEALPGLDEHRCSIGERGGFITRLYRGTYVPHIVEHVALELQSMIGHDVGYGRSRGGDVEGEYTVTFEHRHEGVGCRAAALALDIVQHGLAGTLAGVTHAVAELEMLASTGNAPPLIARVTCGVTGGGGRAELRAELASRIEDDALIVDVSPSFLLQAGLPYGEADMAVVLDAELTDVPERYRDEERARRLVSVVADVVRRGGVVVCPAKAWEIQDYARGLGCGVAIFSAHDDITRRDRKVARSAAWVLDDQIVIEHHGRRATTEALRSDVAPHVQAAAALAAFTHSRQRASA
ncbi:MAG: hypothetical protein ABIT38_03825 [Gemmatimonadaceae bacterium]